MTSADTIEPVSLFGPNGTGKTGITQPTVEQLRDKVIDLNIQYVNCREHHTRFKTVYRLSEGIDKALASPRITLAGRLKLISRKSSMKPPISTNERARKTARRIEAMSSRMNCKTRKMASSDFVRPKPHSKNEKSSAKTTELRNFTNGPGRSERPASKSGAGNQNYLRMSNSTMTSR